MISSLRILVGTLRCAVMSRADLLVEIAALRHQLEVCQRQVKRPRLRRGDRLFWIWLARTWPHWKSALVIVKPDTVLRWQRAGYRRCWQSKPKGSPGRPRIPARHRQFIRRISSENPWWGQDRIALEMKLKLGIDHAASTVARYMADDGGPGMTWGAFLRLLGGAALAETRDAGTRLRGFWSLLLALVAAARQKLVLARDGGSGAPAGLAARTLEVLTRSRPHWRLLPERGRGPGPREHGEPVTSDRRSRLQVDVDGVPVVAWSSRLGPRAPPKPRPLGVTRPSHDELTHEYELAA